MKLKLDENIDLRVVTLLQLAGHDVATVPGQGLSSAPDPEIIEVCRREGRCLITCDRSIILPSSTPANMLTITTTLKWRKHRKISLVLAEQKK